MGFLRNGLARYIIESLYVIILSMALNTSKSYWAEINKNYTGRFKNPPVQTIIILVWKSSNTPMRNRRNYILFSKRIGIQSYIDWYSFDQQFFILYNFVLFIYILSSWEFYNFLISFAVNYYHYVRSVRLYLLVGC